MTDDRVYNVLFLCTGNSARSVIAETLLNKSGRGRFKAFSAGSFPKGEVNPYALRLLSNLGLPTADLRSKSWDEFARPGAPPLDFIITVCDNAAGEICPIWPGKPVTAHWGIPDPAAAEGTDAEIATAFATAARQLRARIDLFLSLPLASIDRMTIQNRMRDIQTTSIKSETSHD
ncbi:MAG: arsenate reductase ArsC [Hyphomonadaceae bacterium]|nr:arsenate reductase ArsC [Hyphomonadaceae bacterium]